MLSTLLAVALSAAPTSPEVAVISVIWPRAIAPAHAERVEEEVRAALTSQRVVLVDAERTRAARPEAQACGSKADCLAALGRGLGAGVVVRVEASTLGQDTTVLVRAILTADGARAAEVVVTVPVKAIEVELRGKLGPIADAVLVATRTPAADAPTERALVPAPPRDEPAVHLEVPAPPRKRSALPWVFFGGGAAAAVAGGVFAIVGGTARSAYLGTRLSDAEPRTTTLTAAQRSAAVSAINTDFSVALGCAIAAAVLAVTGLVVFASDAP